MSNERIRAFIKNKSAGRSQQRASKCLIESRPRANSRLRAPFDDSTIRRNRISKRLGETRSACTVETREYNCKTRIKSSRSSLDDVAGTS